MHPYLEVLIFNVMVFGGVALGKSLDLNEVMGDRTPTIGLALYEGTKKLECSLAHSLSFCHVKMEQKGMLLCLTFRTVRNRFLFFKPPLFYGHFLQQPKLRQPCNERRSSDLRGVSAEF